MINNILAIILLFTVVGYAIYLMAWWLLFLLIIWILFCLHCQQKNISDDLEVQ